MKTRLILLLTTAILASAAAAYAHHSFAATYDESKSISIKGKMVQFSFRNPHSFVAVEVTTGTETIRAFGVTKNTSVPVADQCGKDPPPVEICLATAAPGYGLT